MNDGKETTPTGIQVVGKMEDLAELNCHYSNIILAIDSPDVRLLLLKKVEDETSFRVALVSSNAYVSPSTQIMPECIIGPMAVIQSMSIIATACIISAGAVVNHASMLWRCSCRL